MGSRRGLLVALAATLLLVVGCGNDETAFMISTEAAVPGEPTAFAATGAAVDEGRLCSNGRVSWVRTVHADSGLPETEEDPPREGEVLWVEYRFTCGDGTGEFVLRAAPTVDSTELETVVDTGEMSAEHPVSWVSGTGDYDNLQIEGVRQWTVAEAGSFEGGVRDLFSGTLAAG